MGGKSISCDTEVVYEILPIFVHHLISSLESVTSCSVSEPPNPDPTNAKTGAMLNSVPVPNATPDFAGSCVIAYAATKEEILAVINEDPYAKAGVWDLEKVSFHP